jgi:predicted Zn-dependent protease
VTARVIVALLAVAVLAWLAVMERNERLIARGVTTAGQLDTPANVARAEADLRAARLLNPTTTPDLNRAVLYIGLGRPAEATALLQDVVRREPDNRIAWGTLYGFTRDRDPAAARRALDALRRLDPLAARRD